MMDLLRKAAARAAAGAALAGVVAFATPAGAQTLAGGRTLASGIDTTTFDYAVRPQDDFFRFVNGGWLARTEIPGDATRWGAFNELRERSREALHRIVEAAAASNAAPGSNRRKVGDMYASYMDSVRIEQLGITPLAGDLAAIGRITSTAHLPAAFAGAARIGVRRPFSVGVGADQKNSRVNIVSVSQSGLGMPDRDYYLRTDAKAAATRAAYATYIERLLTLANQPDAAGAAQRILALETAIAQQHWDRVKNRDRHATYNRMPIGQLATLTPSFDWKAYLDAADLAAATEVVVRQPAYFAALDSIVKATPVATWREYLTFALLDASADALPAAFGSARFEFRARTLAGQQAQAARWKRAVDVSEGTLGEALGQLYVAEHFKPEAKARMEELVRNLRKAYEIGIDSLEWMSPETKAQAKDKLAKFTVKIGYPDQWRDYSALEIRRDDLVGNLKRAAAFEYADMTSRLGKPVDRDRWGMTPQTVNAYYNATNNEIVFPAAILQAPFFDVDADDAVNYGGIGAVIGHEIGHGFDDQGRKSDGDGNLRDWWTAADAQAFEARAEKLGAQYAAISPIEGMHINPRLTMGENIGDLSGLAQAYRAYRLSLGGKEPPVIGGFTGDQRFFIGFAQIWRVKQRDDALRQLLLTDPHAPGTARAFVPLANNDAFMQAFGVKQGDGMWRAPEERVRIW